MLIPLFLVTLTAMLLSIDVNIVLEISRFAVSLNFSTSVTVPAVFHSEGWSTDAVIVFVAVALVVLSAHCQ